MKLNLLCPIPVLRILAVVSLFNTKRRLVLQVKRLVVLVTPSVHVGRSVLRTRKAVSTRLEYSALHVGSFQDVIGLTIIPLGLFLRPCAVDITAEITIL